MQFKINLKGSTKLETYENYAILVVVIGAALLSLGIGLSAANPAGISAALAMGGGVITFLATVALIFVWILKETKGE